MAKPTLALIPAAQGSKFYSVLPSNGVGDFQFSRSGSATRINKDGLIETVSSGVSRLNYPLIDGVVKGCPSHLLEPSRTNLITYSEDFSQSDWSGGNVTRELNQIISPDGTLNATKLSATASFSQIQQSYTSVNNTDYTLSLFVKSPSSNVIGLRLASGVNDVRREFNLSTLSIQSMGGNNQELIDEGIVDFGNGWYRIFLTCKSDGTSSFLNIYPKNSSDATFQSVYVWGAMLEQNSVASSYIPTQGTIQTRSAETANGSGDAATFNDSEGVLMAEISALANDGTNRRISISDGTTSNRLLLSYNSTSNQIQSFLANPTVQFNFYHTLSNSIEFNKIAVKYKQNDFALWINGVKVETDTNGTIANGLNTLNFDEGSGASDFYGNTKQIQYFDTALNDSDLETLTSWTSFTDMANGQQYSIK